MAARHFCLTQIALLPAHLGLQILSQYLGELNSIQQWAADMSVLTLVGMLVLVVHSLSLWWNRIHCCTGICGGRGWCEGHLGGQQAAQGGPSHQLLHCSCLAQQR